MAISRCGEGEMVELRSFAGVGEDCVRRMEPRLSIGYRTELTLAASGRVHLDEARAARCLETIATTCTAAPVLIGGGVCSRLFDGTVADGAPCKETLECGGGGWCSFPSGATDGCGICRPARPLGAACAVDQQCSRAQSPEGVLCASAAGFRCTALEIAAEAAEGQPCGTVTSEALVRVTACGPALWCDLGDDSSTGLCRPLVAPGAECDQGRSVCQHGHVCPDFASRCQPQTIVTTAGEPCDREGNARVCNHYDGLTCDEGTCRPLSRAAGSCREDGDCAFGLFCDEPAGLCQPPRPEGGGCQEDGDCIDERCVDTGTPPNGICQAPRCGGDS